MKAPSKEGRVFGRGREQGEKEKPQRELVDLDELR